jgi:hemerythrin-like domain-containing protein
MYSIDILVKEHELIIDITNILKKECVEILKGKEVDTDLFEQIIYFVKNFADKYHHQKEEKILFRVMMDTLPPVATQLIRGGMMVEHDLGRMHVSLIVEALEEYKQNPSDELKLEIIANAVSYCNLLARHIGKEDAAVYTFAERALTKENLEIVENETHEHEENEENIKIRNKCLNILKELKERNND